MGVLNPIPIISTVTPSTFPEGTAQVAVNGSQFVFGAQIMWNGVAVPTTLVSSTQLVAEYSRAHSGNFPAAGQQSQSRRGKLGHGPGGGGPGQVVLTLYTGDGSDVRVSNPLNFGLTVNGTINTAVTLQVNGIANGNAQFGTAVSNAERDHHLYRAAGGSNAQQRCAAHHHQRRQSGGIDHAEYLRAESDSDSQLGVADELQRRAADHDGRCRPARASSTARRC